MDLMTIFILFLPYTSIIYIYIFIYLLKEKEPSIKNNQTRGEETKIRGLPLSMIHNLLQTTHAWQDSGQQHCHHVE